MNLRRLSSAVGLPDSERFRVPRPGGSGVPSKSFSLLNRRQLQLTIQPVRLTPKPGTSTKDKSEAEPSVRISKLRDNQATSGPSRQLILSTPAPVSDALDGISELPPSASTRDRVLRSDLKKTGDLSQTYSRIPCVMKSRASSNKILREKSLVKRRSSVQRYTRTNFGATHHRIKAVTQLSEPASPSACSIDQFEADELAAAAPTPGPSHLPSSKTCKGTILGALEEVKNVQQELVLSHKQFLDKQIEHFEKQNKLIEKQTEVLCKLSSILDKNIEIFNNHVAKKDKRARSKRRFSTSNHSDSSEDDLGDNEKENQKVRSKGDHQAVHPIGLQAESQYNEIRSEFGFLRLKTPGKDRGESALTTPKTPKSILSRTLQMQLGDIFEES